MAQIDYSFKEELQQSNDDERFEKALIKLSGDVEEERWGISDDDLDVDLNELFID